MSIDKTYFIREITIPNLNQASVAAELAADISFYEKEILTDLLGYELYTAYTAGIGVGSPEQKWLDLRDGKEFSFDFCGRTVNTKWNGFENAEKDSFIAYYVYANWVRKKMQTLTSIGVGATSSENSSAVSGERKMVGAWGRFLELYGKTPDWVTDYAHEPAEHFDDKPSAYNFLLANLDIYGNWSFTKRGDVVIGGF